MRELGGRGPLRRREELSLRRVARRAPAVELDARVGRHALRRRAPAAGLGAPGARLTRAQRLQHLTQTGAVLVQTQVPLERVQLPHEVEVGRDVCLARAHQLEGVAQTQAVALHEVGERDGDTARHARHAVHQHAAARRHRLLNKSYGLWKVYGEVLTPMVRDGYFQIVDTAALRFKSVG